MKKIIKWLLAWEIVSRKLRVLIALLGLGLSGYLYFYTKLESMKLVALLMLILLIITILQADIYKEHKEKDILLLFSELDFDYLFRCIDYYDEDLYGSFYEDTKSILRNLEKQKKK